MTLIEIEVPENVDGPTLEATLLLVAPEKFQGMVTRGDVSYVLMRPPVNQAMRTLVAETYKGLLNPPDVEFEQQMEEVKAAYIEYRDQPNTTAWGLMVNAAILLLYRLLTDAGYRDTIDNV